jgi:hypothetical protein
LIADLEASRATLSGDSDVDQPETMTLQRALWRAGS